MRDNIIILLTMLLLAAAIGQATSNSVRGKIQMRRRSSRSKTELMILAANIKNGKMGIYSHLIIK